VAPRVAGSVLLLTASPITCPAFHRERTRTAHLRERARTARGQGARPKDKS